MRPYHFAIGLCLVGCQRTVTPPDPQFVAQWLRTSLSLVRRERLGPPVASRISAYSAIARYEGYAADPLSGERSIAPHLNGLGALPSPTGPVDGAIVAAESERVVLDSLFRDGFAGTRRTIDSLAEAQIAARSAAGVADGVRERSVAHGRNIAAAVLGWASRDGFFDQLARPWVPPGGRDKWSNTATPDQFVPLLLSGESDLVAPSNPGVAVDLERASERFVFVNRPKNAAGTTLPTFNPVRPTAPFWGEIRPFVLTNADECRLPEPPAYSERSGSPFWRMAREFADSMASMTPEKKATALFWADNPVATGTPGFHWVAVVNQMIGQRRLTAGAGARLSALVSVAIADAFIATWKAKFRSMVVRPVTYMHRVFDPSFTTVIPTPPFPEYPSGHSTQSAAVVRVLSDILGDTVAFVDSSQVDIGHTPRSFPSFSAALAEVSVSRIYAGVHYVPAVVDGVVMGRCVGERVMQRLAPR